MGDFDSVPAAEEMATLAADLERRAAQFGELREKMSALSATESTADGRISVTVDNTGIPTAITLAEQTKTMRPAQVAEQIMNCMRRAQARLRGTVTDTVHEVVGTDPAGAAIVENFVERFPDPPPDDTSAGPAGSPPQPAAPPPPSPPPPNISEPSPPPATGRNRIVTPEGPDDEDEYYKRDSWLV